MNWILKIGGIAILAMGLKNAISEAIAKIKIVDAKINLIQRKEGGIVYAIELFVRNDTNISAEIKSFRGGIYYGDRKLSTLDVEDPHLIPSKSDAKILMEGQISFINIAENVINLLLSGDWKQAAFIRGSLTAAGFSVPINRKLTVNDLI
jgi:hypothetical protein